MSSQVDIRQETFELDTSGQSCLNIDDFEGCEFSKKFRAGTSGDMEKLMACVGH